MQPDYALARHWYGSFLESMNRHNEAIAQSARAEELERLTAPLDSVPLTRHGGVLALGPPTGKVRYLVVPVDGAGPGIGGLLVATPTRQASFGPTDLLRSMLLIAPVILVSAGLVGYWLIKHDFEPAPLLLGMVLGPQARIEPKPPMLQDEALRPVRARVPPVTAEERGLEPSRPAHSPPAVPTEAADHQVAAEILLQRPVGSGTGSVVAGAVSGASTGASTIRGSGTASTSRTIFPILMATSLRSTYRPLGLRS